MGFWDVPARAMRKHSLGKRRFILQVGLLEFGLPYSLIMIAGEMRGVIFPLEIFKYRRGMYDEFSEIAVMVATRALTAAIGGVIIGSYLWRKICRQKAREEKIES